MSEQFTPEEATGPRRVYLHIGLPKTGTTYLQDRYWRNRDAALRQGMLYPGQFREAHFQAAVQLQSERYPHWVDPRHPGAWERLVEQIRAWPGSALISHELLATAGPQEVATALASLDFAEVHVVCTTRDLARQIPSVWQENIKNQDTTDFLSFVASVRGSRDTEFWGYQHVPRILRSWGAGLPSEHVHVVTTPSPVDSPDLLWRRFNAALGVDPTRLPRDLPSANNSLDAVQLEVLRRLNAQVRDAISWGRYESVVKEYLAGNILILASRRGVQRLPVQEFEWVNDVAAEFIAEIRTAGYHVVGDLADLEPRSSTTGPRPDPDDAEMLEVALDALAEIVRTMPAPAADRTNGDRFKTVARDLQRRVLSLWSSSPLRVTRSAGG